MSKKEIVDNIWENLQGEVDGLTKGMVKSVVDAVFPEIINVTNQSGKCRLPNFGTFTKYFRAERTASHPQTREKIVIPACNSVKFSTGEAFKAAVQDK